MLFYTELPRFFLSALCNTRSRNFQTPATVHTNHSEDQPEDGSVHQPKHVAINTTNTSNKLTVVYEYIIL